MAALRGDGLLFESGSNFGTIELKNGREAEQRTRGHRYGKAEQHHAQIRRRGEEVIPAVVASGLRN